MTVTRSDFYVSFFRTLGSKQQAANSQNLVSLFIDEKFVDIYQIINRPHNIT